MSNDNNGRAPIYRAHSADAKHDREAVIAIWRGNLGSEERLAAKFNWFYRNGPWGSPLIEMLRCEASAQWVGVAAAGPRRMLWQGREIRAGVLVDFAVIPAHRSLGPALQLQQSLIAASTDHFDLLYGFPNPKAVPVFRRLGYAELGQLVRYARIVRHGPYLQRKLPRAVAQPLGWLIDRLYTLLGSPRRLRSSGVVHQWCDQADPRMDDLWKRSAPGQGLVGVRDVAMLRWRFDQMPGRQIRYLLVNAPGSGRLLAWFACEAHAHTLHIRDFWSVDAERSMQSRFVDALVDAARRSGHATVNVECAGPSSAFAGWIAAGFVERERQPVFGKWLHPTPITATAQIHFTSLDEDE